PRRYDIQIRKVQDSSRRGEQTERAEKFRKARYFFLNNRIADIHAPCQAAIGLQSAKELQDTRVPPSLKRKPPGPRHHYGALDGADYCATPSEELTTDSHVSDQTSNNAQGANGLRDVFQKWIPSSLKRRSLLSRLKNASDTSDKNGEQASSEACVRLSTQEESRKYAHLPASNSPKLDTRAAAPKAYCVSSDRDLTKEVLYEELRKVGTTGDYIRTREILTTLIKHRGERPNRRHYQALLLANTNAQHGSPAEVAGILQQMQDEGIALDSAAYHAIIKVLSIHPDYLLRRQLLEELRQRWFSLSDEGWQDVIIGMLRDKQVEVAVETLQNVQQEGIRIQSWLYDLLIFNLCDAGEYDEALSILQFRVDNGEQLISGNVWHHLLDTASSAFHHPATLFAWRKRVERSYLNPSSGLCLSVLNTAARYGDYHLATDVIRVLGNRNQNLQLHHYEALVESYLPSDLRTAFNVLTIMTSSGMPPTESSTRAIFLHLSQSPSLPETSLAILRELSEQQGAVPAEAVNVVIESYIYHGQFDEALELYKTLHTLCPSGPVTSTFNTLFRGCRTRKDVAMFLTSEMVAMKISPNALTYDRLIIVCVEASSSEEELTDAWRYLDEMRRAGWWPRDGTTMALARKACLVGDERVWQLEDGPNGEVGLDKVLLKKVVDDGWMAKDETTQNDRE
ncbi:MAG: hypothetical protein Q9181_006191, partial [Wetmoreana brouardii]